MSLEKSLARVIINVIQLKKTPRERDAIEGKSGAKRYAYEVLQKLPAD
jgi:hypothetical protein